MDAVLIVIVFETGGTFPTELLLQFYRRVLTSIFYFLKLLDDPLLCCSCL